MLSGPDGWHITKELPPNCTILAVDRHGKVVHTAAQLTHSTKRSPLVYVGTSAAFVAVVTNTRILASDGKRWTASDLVRCGDVSQIQFETVVRIRYSVKPKPSVNELWQCLSRACAFGNSESVALRCRDPIFCERLKLSFPEKKRIGNQVFAIVQRKNLAAALEANWGETMTSLVTCWLNNLEDNRVEVERSFYYIALWFATALTESDSGYVFRFDKLQHSSYVFVSATREAPQPIQRGACAFFAPHETCESLLSWKDSSLAPIGAGFLLAGN